MILVEKPGSLTLIQDLGRPGFAHLAVPRSGAADRRACIRANRHVGNPDGAAVLEMTLLGARLRFEIGAVIALAGADMDARLDGMAIPLDQPITVRGGQVLACHAARVGVRAYVAVAGGIDAPRFLGSSARDVLSGIGPPPLRAGQRIAIGFAQGADGTPEPAPTVAGAPVLRYLPGPREDWVTAEALAALSSSPFAVSPDSNRIALRLRGPRLTRAIDRELPSEGLLGGAIQVPPDGQPVVMLADYPTTGGYPVVGVVVPEDLWLLAQSPPGAMLRFTPAT